MKQVGVFYGPKGGSTEKVAKQIADQFGGSALFYVGDVTAADVDRFDNVIFGVATLGRHLWDSKYDNPWDTFLPQLDKVNLDGKTFAIFGLGDHLTYPNNFVDSMGIVAERLMARGAKIVGKCPTSDYTFNDSEAVKDGQFVGLPLDDVYEAEKTEDRIKDWTLRLKNSFE